MTKNIVIGILAILLIVGGLYFFKQSDTYQAAPDEEVVERTGDSDPMPVEPDGGIGDGAQPLPEMNDEPKSVIGTSAGGSEIMAYHFGAGEKEVLFVGGVHGAYAANTSVLSHDLISDFDSGALSVPEGLKVTIIPTLNPDGLKKVGGVSDVVNGAGNLVWEEPASHDSTIPGRFNENGVDLNRNFDCDWAATSMWRSQEVSGGTEAFSEPEAAAVKAYLEENNVIGAVVYFSAEGKVYPSACGGNPSAASTALAEAYGSAAGYGVGTTFDAYTINGDMVNYFAKVKVPAISVLLSAHGDSDTVMNRKGVTAMLEVLAN